MNTPLPPESHNDSRTAPVMPAVHAPMRKGFSHSVKNLLAAAGVVFGAGAAGQVYESLVAQPELNHAVSNESIDLGKELEILRETKGYYDRSIENTKASMTLPDLHKGMKRVVNIDQHPRKLVAGIVPGSIDIEMAPNESSAVGGEYAFTPLGWGTSIDVSRNALLIEDDKLKLQGNIFGKLITFTKGKDGKIENLQVTPIINTDNEKSREEVQKMALSTMQVIDASVAAQLGELIQALTTTPDMLDKVIAARHEDVNKTAKQAEELAKSPEFIAKVKSGMLEIETGRWRISGFKYDEHTVVTRHIYDMDRIYGYKDTRREITAGDYSIASDAQSGISVITFKKPLFNKEDALQVSARPLRLQETYLAGYRSGDEKKPQWGAKPGVMNEYGARREVTGTREVTIGYMWGMMPVRRNEDVVNTKFEDEKMNIIADVPPENMGAPIFNAQGEVAGVVGTVYKNSKDAPVNIRGSEVTVDMIQKLVDQAKAELAKK